MTFHNIHVGVADILQIKVGPQLKEPYKSSGDKSFQVYRADNFHSFALGNVDTFDLLGTAITLRIGFIGMKYLKIFTVTDCGHQAGAFQRLQLQEWEEPISGSSTWLRHETCHSPKRQWAHKRFSLCKLPGGVAKQTILLEAG
jgi:hypothetical protein